MSRVPQLIQKNWHSCILPPHTQCWFDWVSKAKATKLRSHEESGLLWPAEREKTHPFYFLLDVSQDEGITKIGLYCLYMISGTSLSFRSCCQLAQCQSVRLDFFANVYQPLHLHLGKWQTNWMRQLLRVEASVLTEKEQRLRLSFQGTSLVLYILWWPEMYQLNNVTMIL